MKAQPTLVERRHKQKWLRRLQDNAAHGLSEMQAFVLPIGGL